MSAFGSAFYPLLEVNTLHALVGNLRIFVRIRIRILPVVESADPHVRRSAFYPTEQTIFETTAMIHATTKQSSAVCIYKAFHYITIPFLTYTSPVQISEIQPAPPPFLFPFLIDNERESKQIFHRHHHRSPTTTASPPPL